MFEMLSNYISQSIGITKYSLLELRKTELARRVCAKNSLGLCCLCVCFKAVSLGNPDVFLVILLNLPPPSDGVTGL